VASNPDNMDPELARRIAENEARFRVANEKIEAARLRLQADPITLPFVCECGRLECLQTVRLTIAEYESVRSDGTCFVCVPGHEITVGGVGRVVQDTRSYVVVQKIGVAGDVAEQHDPRADEATEQAG
jgi:hypothetical protein